MAHLIVTQPLGSVLDEGDLHRSRLARYDSPVVATGPDQTEQLVDS